MKFYMEEYKCAEEYWRNRSFPGLSAEQRKAIIEKGKDMIKFTLRHPVIHHLISLSVFFVIFIADWWILLRLGSYIASPVLSGILIGVLHSYLMYNLVIYTIHEGAAHKLIVLRRSPISKFFGVIANNIGRIALAESGYYTKNHLRHHANFATAKDAEFLNFVFPKRLYKSFIPYASIFNFSDFKAHTGSKYTLSRVLAIMLFLVYHIAFAAVMAQTYSWIMIFLALILISPNLTLWLDRLRQYTEHNTMPLDVVSGARDLGAGFWGMLIGGGPWGQPCHWTHHLIAGVPWYNQIRLHNFIGKVLTPEQKKFFFLKPIIGFPQKLFEIIRITGICRRNVLA